MDRKEVAIMVKIFSGDISLIIEESVKSTIEDNNEMIVQRISQTLKSASGKTDGEIIGHAIVSAINLSTSMGVVATLKTLTTLGLIDLEIEKIKLL